ncbi:MAG TPA: M6 family metalloprotease domain-containing protein, partial [Candidatus Binatia bacterium]|nr:M6 family metalloprotease domain-containing protein [Candidatus Binatia bacterium]
MPPVPGKHGLPGPREGFSTSRLRPDFALLPGRGEHIRAEAQANYRVLAVRVAFSDTPIDSSTAYYNRLLFFMNQYWSQVTAGQVTLQPTLWDSVFTLPHPMAYYGDDARFQERVVFLVRDMVALADSTVDFRSYDSIVIFHAGQGQEADVLDNSHDQVWSAFVTQEDMRTVLGPDSTGAVGIKTNDAITPGNFLRVKEAVELPESESQDGYVFGMTGVCCHEFGHQLGLPDLYDTNGDVGGSSQGLGAWDIMATGVWDANGFVPCEPSAWSKAFLGVLSTTRAVTDQAVTLSEVERPIGANP